MAESNYPHGEMKIDAQSKMYSGFMKASAWGAHRLDQAISLLTDTDLQLRSAGQNAPAMALVERMLIRLAMLGASR